MKTQFNLSEKRRALKTIENSEGYGYADLDVKEFIRLLKEAAKCEHEEFVDTGCGEWEFDEDKFNQFINQLAGEKLI
jgi:hypothetical protein